MNELFSARGAAQLTAGNQLHFLGRSRLGTAHERKAPMSKPCIH